MPVKFYIQACNRLSERQKREIAALIQACKDQEPIHMNPLLEAEENMDPELPCFYLAYGEGRDSLIGFLSLFFPDGETAEAAVFVRPDCRRQGVMAALLEKTREALAEERLSFYLVSDGNSKEADAVAKHWKLKADHTEMMMEIEAADLVKASDPTADQKKTVYVRKRGQNSYLYRKGYQNYIGKCYLIPLSETVTYLYGLEIKQEWRNQGYGRVFLREIGRRLESSYQRKEEETPERQDHQNQMSPVLRLQVTSENPAACHLYESCGFQISEQIVYYYLE